MPSCQAAGEDAFTARSGNRGAGKAILSSDYLIFLRLLLSANVRPLSNITAAHLLHNPKEKGGSGYTFCPRNRP